MASYTFNPYEAIWRQMSDYADHRDAWARIRSGRGTPADRAIERAIRQLPTPLVRQALIGAALGVPMSQVVPRSRLVVEL